MKMPWVRHLHGGRDLRGSNYKECRKEKKVKRADYYNFCLSVFVAFVNRLIPSLRSLFFCVSPFSVPPLHPCCVLSHLLASLP